MQQAVWACPPGWETTLAAELGRVWPAGSHAVAQPGWVSSRWDELALAPRSIAFASQCLPGAEALEAPSISTWARGCADRLLGWLIEHEGPWRLHVFSQTGDATDAGHRRAALVRAAFVELLRDKRRRLLRSLVPDDTTLPTDDELLVQVALAARDQGWTSCARWSELGALGRAVSRLPGGIVPVASDRAAPSRAFAKLAEAELRIGRPIASGETCVDLGSSPGGWAWQALKRGASVVAVDRSPLEAPLMHEPKLEFVQGDAFRYQPPAPVDWLLSDVVAYPARIDELLARWFAEGWCRWFVVTVKFQGRDDDEQLAALDERLAREAFDHRIRRLSANKNEATIYGCLPGAGAQRVGL